MENTVWWDTTVNHHTFKSTEKFDSPGLSVTLAHTFTQIERVYVLLSGWVQRPSILLAVLLQSEVGVIQRSDSSIEFARDCAGGRSFDMRVGEKLWCRSLNRSIPANGGGTEGWSSTRIRAQIEWRGNGNVESFEGMRYLCTALRAADEQTTYFTRVVSTSINRVNTERHWAGRWDYLPICSCELLRVLHGRYDHLRSLESTCRLTVFPLIEVESKMENKVSELVKFSGFADGEIYLLKVSCFVLLCVVGGVCRKNISHIWWRALIDMWD